METILIHEYFRILVPALVFVGILKILTGSLLPEDAGELLIVAAGVGLLVSPLFDRLAKKSFHRQVIGTKFYERFIDSFFKHYRIASDEVSGSQLVSFSGPLKMPHSPQAELLLEVYKLFSRQGWGTEEEKYRVRVEKSFAILYFSLFCYASVIFVLSLFQSVIKLDFMHPILGRWYVNALLFLILMSVALWESTSRFRASLENEFLILGGHFKELKECYDGRSDVLAEQKV